MKRLIAALLLITTIAVSSVGLSANAAAVNLFPVCSTNSGAGGTTVCKDAITGQNTSSNPIVGIIGSAIQVISIVIGIAAVVGIVISGLRMALANGDSNSIASARSALLYSLVGVAVAAAAQVIVKFVLGSIK